MPKVPDHWRLNLSSEQVGFGDLSWDEALKEAAAIEFGDLAAQSEGECVQCEFDGKHAAVLYMGRDGVILRPYFPGRPPEAQDLTPYFCKCCGILLGPMDEYLARFFERAEGFLLFERVLCGPSLPTAWPESDSAKVRADSVLEWRPLPNEA